MINWSIPFNKASLVGTEHEYIDVAVRRGHISGDGAFGRRCEELLQGQLGVSRVLLTTSCTHALEMAALLLDLKAGDEVLVPSFTFASTINAFVLRGVVPIFIDIRSDTLNVDESLLERAITPATRAIVVVHYAGVACEMDAIQEIARRNNLSIVEDNAHGLFGTYKGRPLGTFGALATQSFHETKNITCGEGGALVVNDSLLVERAEIIREKGTDRSRFFRGQVDKYTWVDIGSSYVLSEILAAFLCAQLEQGPSIQDARRRIWYHYNANLRAWAGANGVRLPVVPAWCGQAYHMYYVLLSSAEQREALIAHLKRFGILSVFHYLPLHLSPMGQRLGGKSGQCPVTEDVSGRLLRLPFYNSLDQADQDTVISAIVDWAPDS